MRERRELALEKKGEEGRKKGSRGYMGRANHATPFGVNESRQPQWRDTSRYLPVATRSPVPRGQESRRPFWRDSVQNRAGPFGVTKRVRNGNRISRRSFLE